LRPNARSNGEPTVSDEKPLYPIFLKLDRKPVLVVGGGRVAERKIAVLLDAGAIVTVVSPQNTTGIEKLADTERINLIRRKFETSDLEDCALVVAATADRQTNAAVAAAARERHIFINAVDDPPSCDFYVPAIERRGPLTVAVCTTGAAPGYSSKLRDAIAKTLPARLGSYLRFLEKLRGRLPDLLPASQRVRSQVIKTVIGSDAERLFLAGDEVQAEKIVEDIIRRTANSDGENSE
jgi:siroheme synthase-like protein